MKVESLKTIFRIFIVSSINLIINKRLWIKFKDKDHLRGLGHRMMFGIIGERSVENVVHKTQNGMIFLKTRAKVVKVMETIAPQMMMETIVKEVRKKTMKIISLIMTKILMKICLLDIMEGS